MRGRPSDLVAEIGEIQDSLGLHDYHAFLIWFLEQTTYLSRKQILRCICDGSHDKGIDAIIIDDTEREVNIIQSKFSGEFDGRIPESEVKLLADTRRYFKNRDSISKIVSHSNATVANLLPKAYDCVKGKNYGLNLILISTKRASPGLMEQRNELGLKDNDNVYDRERILTLYDNHLRDFNPSLPSYKLRFSPTDQFLVKRQPGQTAYVLSVPCTELRDLYLKFGDDLFRKNVRDFLGTNRANTGMNWTLEKYPENFWYFNNGITMLCDKADPNVAESYVEVENPQIINGCQTTKTIGRFKGEVKGNILVRIVESKDNEFAAQLTLFQNTSNPVKNRDLKSNDIVQIRLKRELARRGYYLEVKRGQEFSKYRARHRGSWRIDFPYGSFNNEELAKCLATVKIRPDIAASKGSEVFFDEYYEKLFPSTLSVLECLRIIIIQRLIRGSYGREKWHGLDNAFRFKNRALWYLLRYVSDSLKGPSWTRVIVSAGQDGRLLDKKLTSEFRKIASGYFELLYVAWRKSRLFEGFDSYLTSPEARKDMKRQFGSKLSELKNMTLDLFEKRVAPTT